MYASLNNVLHDFNYLFHVRAFYLKVKCDLKKKKFFPMLTFLTFSENSYFISTDFAKNFEKLETVGLTLILFILHTFQLMFLLFLTIIPTYLTTLKSMSFVYINISKTHWCDCDLLKQL